MPDSRPHACLLTFGSSGDVHPFLGIGTRLLGRGWDVTLVTNARYADLVRGHGLGFAAVGSADDYQKFVDNPDVWHPTRAAKHVFSAAASYAEESYRVLERFDADRGINVVVASSLGVGGRVYHEVTNRPLVSVHLAPTVFRSHVEPPRLPGVPPLGWIPAGVRPTVLRHFWNGADRYVLDPLLIGLNDFRGTLGLPRREGLLGDWWHSPMRTLAMWPDWFAPPPADWPASVRCCGFPLYDERDTAQMPADLDEWLDAGEPPIAFTPGSAMAFGERFFKAAAGACGRLGVRGLLLSRYEKHIPADLPPGVRHAPFAPFGLLLPRCRAMVHHGGVGTLSQALAAGVPQLVMPMAHDQPDNAARLRRLGVADALPPRWFTARRVAARLDRLLRSPEVAAACRDAAGRLAGQDGLEVACDAIEETAAVAASA